MADLDIKLKWDEYGSATEDFCIFHALTDSHRLSVWLDGNGDWSSSITHLPSLNRIRINAYFSTSAEAMSKVEAVYKANLELLANG